MSVAQKLFDEIATSALQINDLEDKEIPKNKIKTQPSKSRYNRSVSFDKKKPNKLIPKCSNLNRPLLKNCKLRDTSLVNFTSIAVNTLVSGPLRCDNNCITAVRKRDKVDTCKCAQKKVALKNSVKQLQTSLSRNYLHSDKASAQCVETVTCGTQFFYILGPNVKEKKYGINDMKIREICQHPISVTKQISTRAGSKPWALTQYPTYGPDF